MHNCIFIHHKTSIMISSSNYLSWMILGDDIWVYDWHDELEILFYFLPYFQFVSSSFIVLIYWKKHYSELCSLKFDMLFIFYQIASSSLGFGPQMTMQLAERLYTQGFIRYFCNNISKCMMFFNFSHNQFSLARNSLAKKISLLSV